MEPGVQALAGAAAPVLAIRHTWSNRTHHSPRGVTADVAPYLAKFRLGGAKRLYDVWRGVNDLTRCVWPTHLQKRR